MLRTPHYAHIYDRPVGWGVRGVRTNPPQDRMSSAPRIVRHAVRASIREARVRDCSMLALLTPLKGFINARLTWHLARNMAFDPV